MDRRQFSAAGSSTPARRFGVRLHDLLTSPVLAGAQVLAGADGLGRVVQSATVMEVKDILPWVKPHSVLVTTGYPLRGAPGELTGLVASLDDRRLSGLLIKLNRYITRLPPEVIAEADRRNFPIVQLPAEVLFDDLLTGILKEVLDHHAAALERSDEVHRTLIGLVLGGGGTRELASAVADLLGAAVLVVGEDGIVLAEAGPAPPQLYDVCAAASAAATGSPASDLRLEKGDLATVPVKTGGTVHGCIGALVPDRSFGEVDITVLERAAMVVALIVNKQLAVAAVESKYRGDFLRDVLYGRAGDTERIVTHCRPLGWDICRPVVVVSAELADSSRASDLKLRSVFDLLAAGWEKAVRARDPMAAVAGYGREVVALLGVPLGADVLRQSRAIISEVARGVGGLSISAGLSRVVDDPRQIPDGYEQARRALRIGRQVHGPGSVANFDGLGAFRLLNTVSDTAELEAFAADALGALADDSADAVDLRKTLQVLLDSNLNVARAARSLHFHYNTLRHRISKLETILGPFTEDPNLRLDVALALKVLQMRQPQG